LLHPSGDRPCDRLKLTRQLFGRASRSNRIDHLSPELRRRSGSVTGASDTSKINFKGIHQTGSTPSEARRWAEETIEETLTFNRLPRQHHKHLKSTNMLERLNEEIRRQTYVVRIFPNADACRRLVRALAVETHENWLEAHRYLNMNELKEHKKVQLRQAA
jgi:putative transposase